MIDNRKIFSAEQAMEILNRRANTFNVVTHGRILGSIGEEIVRLALVFFTVPPKENHHPR
ncbi:MAG: hypothetical protein GDA48_22085 [Hormoscilla sp. GM102CHS1]|nr:hypothetical protein [Hormoscilla sp. GM102CHS1]